MTELPDIIVDYSSDSGLQHIELTTSDKAGRLVGAFSSLSGSFLIERIDVTTPRIGLGKALLRQAQAEAQKLEAKNMVAYIESAECLASMSEVFGADHIRVQRQGEFGSPHDDTAAWLNVPLAAMSDLKEG